jgi:hypothetical protein
MGFLQLGVGHVIYHRGHRSLVASQIQLVLGRIWNLLVDQVSMVLLDDIPQSVYRLDFLRFGFLFLRSVFFFDYPFDISINDLKK